MDYSIVYLVTKRIKIPNVFVSAWLIITVYSKIRQWRFIVRFVIRVCLLALSRCKVNASRLFKLLLKNLFLFAFQFEIIIICLYSFNRWISDLCLFYFFLFFFLYNWFLIFVMRYIFSRLKEKTNWLILFTKFVCVYIEVTVKIETKNLSSRCEMKNCTRTKAENQLKQYQKQQQKNYTNK